MKALVWTGSGQMEIREKEMPDYSGKVLIKVAYAGICGSDTSIYLGKHPRAKAPLVTGHEFSGTVAAIDDSDCRDLKIGDKVIINPLYFCGRCRACLQGNTHVCRSLRLYGIDSEGGMAQYAAVPAKNLYKLPDDIDMALAVLIEPAAVIVHGLRMMKKNYYSSACVTGLGPMGLLTALMLKESGVRDLYAMEANEQRASYARSLGLTVINPMTTNPVDYILEQTGGEGVDCMVEASGSDAMASIMTEITGVRGEILVLSVFKHPAEVNLRDVNFKEQVLIGTRVYTGLDYLDAVDYVSRHGETIRPVISHILPLSEGPDAFSRITTKGTDMMKVLFNCQDV